MRALETVDPSLVEGISGGAGDGEVPIIVRVSDPAALPPGTRVVTRFGDVATVRVPRTQVRDLADCGAVTQLEASRRLRPSVDSGTDDEFDDEEPPPDTPYTRRPEGVVGVGAGTLVSALDWGIDFAHPAFRRADGATRLVAFWDQRVPASPDHPNRWGYGRIHTAEEINRALRTEDPYRTLGYDPADAGGRKGAHGTHVLDIAAGGGLGGGMSGVAPGADLAFVHLARTTEVLGEGDLGDSASLLEALDFVFDLAGETPAIVNCSVGAHGGPHNGDTLLEKGIDNAVSLKPGRCLVSSAGNYRTKRAHTMGRVRQGETRSVDFDVPADDPGDSEVELFYAKADRLTVEVIGPGEQRLARVEPGQNAPLVIDGSPVGHVYHQADYGVGGDRHVDVFYRPRAPGGRWSLSLQGDDVQDGRYHAWIERDRGLQPTFVDEQVVLSSTTGTICNGRLSLTCGSVDPHAPTPQLASFSSAGPTRDGRVKPELVAPGVRIRAARSTPPGESPGARYTSKSGTSMAAPHCTGAVALMFEAAGRPLEIAETRALLFSSLNRAPFAEGAPHGSDLHRYGYGCVDIVAAERAARAWMASDDNDTDAREADDEPNGPELAERNQEGDCATESRADVSLLGNEELIGLPAEFFSARAQAGDLLLRSLPTGLTPHVSLVTSPDVSPPSEVAARGIAVERGGPGTYVEVYEQSSSGDTGRIVGRRLTDVWGRIPRGQALVRRAARSARGGPPIAEIEPATDPVQRAVDRTAAEAERLRRKAMLQTLRLELGKVRAVDLILQRTFLPKLSNDPAAKWHRAEVSRVVEATQALDTDPAPAAFDEHVQNLRLQIQCLFDLAGAFFLKNYAAVNRLPTQVVSNARVMGQKFLDVYGLLVSRYGRSAIVSTLLESSVSTLEKWHGRLRDHFDLLAKANKDIRKHWITAFIKKADFTMEVAMNLMLPLKELLAAKFLNPAVFVAAMDAKYPGFKGASVDLGKSLVAIHREAPATSRALWELVRAATKGTTDLGIFTRELSQTSVEEWMLILSRMLHIAMTSGNPWLLPIPMLVRKLIAIPKALAAALDVLSPQERLEHGLDSFSPSDYVALRRELGDPTVRESLRELGERALLVYKYWDVMLATADYTGDHVAAEQSLMAMRELFKR